MKASSGYAVLGVTLGLAAAFGLLAATSYLVTGDTEFYVELARNIARGGAYVVNGTPEAKFPPGLPVILAPAALLFHGSFAAISRWAAMLASLVFPLCYVWVRRRAPTFAWAVAILTVGSIPFLTLTTGNPMSESIYLAVSLGLLIWADSWTDDSSAQSWGWVVAGSLLLLATVATRTIGIAAVAAAGMMLLVRWKRLRWREVIPFAMGLLFLVAWMRWSATHEFHWYSSDTGGTYLTVLRLKDPATPELGRASLSLLAKRAAGNGVVLTARVGELLTPIQWFKASWYSPLLLLVPVLVAGWWKELRSERKFAALYGACYGGILLLWPYDEGSRYLLPLAPVLWVCLGRGLASLGGWARAHERTARLGLLLWGVLGLAGFALARRLGTASSRQDLAAAVCWSLLIVCAGVGWRRLAAQVQRVRATWLTRAVAAATACYVVAALAQAGPIIVRRARQHAPTDPVPQRLYEAAQWIEANTAPGAVVATSYPASVHFMTGRRAIPLPRQAAATAQREVVERWHPDYLIVLELPNSYIPVSDSARFAVLSDLYPNRWQPVAHLPQLSIYAFR